MRKEREALLVAALAGLLIVGAAAFVLQPALGGGKPETRVLVSQTTQGLTVKPDTTPV